MQGKKNAPAAQPKRAGGGKTIALIGFAVLLVALFVIVAAAEGIGQPSVPSDAIAVVDDAPDGTITKEQFDRALTQTAARQGINQVPAATDPQYKALADAAQSDLLLSRWVLGEAEERGIEISDRQITDELEKVKSQQFGSEKAFQKFLDQSGFTLDEARQRIQLQLISSQIQQDVLPGTPDVSDQEVQDYYDANKAQFEQPENRDVRVILTKTAADANKAKAALGSSPSPQTWQKVANQYSIDEATKSTGGLRQAVVAGQSDPTLDQQIFSSAQGALVGPFKTQTGYYVIEVEKITPGKTTPVSDATDQIRQTLVSARQQEAATNFQTDFREKWTDRTVCADGYVIDQCSNFVPPAPVCTEKQADTQGCPAPVISTKPIAPGTATVFGGSPVPPLPQGPMKTPPGASGTGVPPGLLPTGVAPGTPPGTVPPGSVPPGSVPPGSVPPGSVPPGSVPPGSVPPQTAPPQSVPQAPPGG